MYFLGQISKVKLKMKLSKIYGTLLKPNSYFFILQICCTHHIIKKEKL